VANSPLPGIILNVAMIITVAGITKVRKLLRGEEIESAIRKAFHLSSMAWRTLVLATSLAECATGAIALTGSFHVPDGASMIILGSGFTGSQIYARRSKAQGGCGCMSLRREEENLTWRNTMLAIWVLVAGLNELIVGFSWSGVIIRTWPAVGAALGCVVTLLLSAGLPAGTPICHRPLWRPVSGTLASLKQNGVFDSMARSAGPFQAAFTHRRIECLDEFRFLPAPARRAEEYTVVFRVRHVPDRRRLVVHAVVQAVTRETRGEEPLGKTHATVHAVLASKGLESGMSAS
jgi:hypothetical protein